MPQLKTSLSKEDCLRILGEQIAPLRLMARCTPFRSRTAKVLGKIRQADFILESRRDTFSKRLVGKLESHPAHTIITYEWKRGWHHRMFGDSAFDEDEILSFLREWLKTEYI
jgi:hypothetical protein